MVALRSRCWGAGMPAQLRLRYQILRDSHGERKLSSAVTTPLRLIQENKWQTYYSLQNGSQTRKGTQMTVRKDIYYSLVRKNFRQAFLRSEKGNSKRKTSPLPLAIRGYTTTLYLFLDLFNALFIHPSLLLHNTPRRRIRTFGNLTYHSFDILFIDL